MPNYPDAGAQAREYLRNLWRSCDSLGISQPLTEPNLNLPTEFPDAIDSNNPLYRVLAGKINPERRANKEYCQAFLFEYQDVLGFVATLETNSQAENISGWRELFDQWIGAVGDGNVPRAIMEGDVSFHGLAREQQPVGGIVVVE